MLGESLLVCPILTPDTNDVECVLPAGSGKWCLYKPYGLDGSDKRAAFNDDWTLEYHQTECFNMLGDDEETTTLSTNNTIALIRAGSIVPMKFPYELDGSGIMTLDQIRDVNPYMIHAVLDEASEASGFVFVDDGKRSEKIKSLWKCILYIFSVNPVNSFTAELTIQDNKLTNEPKETSSGSAGCDDSNLELLKIIGIEGEVRRVSIYAIVDDEFINYQLKPDDFNYAENTLNVFIPYINLKLCNPFELSWA